MATKTQTPEPAPGAEQPERTRQDPELLGIEELRAKHKVGRAVFAGTCAAQGWRPGRQITEAAFLTAIAAFTGGPMSGAPSGKEAGR